MDAGADVLARLRACQGEISQAIFTRVLESVSDGGSDVEYVEGLRVAVAAAVEFGLAGLEAERHGAGGFTAAIPAAALMQARRAARSGVSLDAVLRRYVTGHALLWDYVMEEADRVERAGGRSGLRELSRAQTSLLDRLVVGVTREHVAECERAGYSREQRLLERVRVLLSGERLDEVREALAGELDRELGYELEAEHLGVIVRGPGAREALVELAEGLDRRALSVASGRDTAWGWLGGQRPLRMADLRRAVPAVNGLSLAVGEPARGLAGWRVTHRQAQAALLVALRRPQALTRYADVVLLAAALEDETLSRALVDIYLKPLQNARDGGVVWRQTLCAYLAAECNATSAAARLKVSRSTVEKRLHTIEARLGRSLHPCPPELQIALDLHELAPDRGKG